MKAQLFQVDAFAERPFEGNPAAVVPLDAFLSDELMQTIAAENNLSETAFIVPEDDIYRLRWFTPAVEVPLCGHATLASAAVVMQRLEPDRDAVVFHTASGPLTVHKTSGSYVMNLPARSAEAVAAPAGLATALGAVPLAVFANSYNYMAVLDSAQTVRELAPDMAAIARIDRPGVIVTAPGDDGTHDFISRYFAPAKGIPEDPVTGAAHCMLAPYWATQLGKTAFRAYQASRRGGDLVCRVLGDRVELEGSCVFYMEGEADI